MRAQVPVRRDLGQPLCSLTLHETIGSSPRLNSRYRDLQYESDSFVSPVGLCSPEALGTRPKSLRCGFVWHNILLAANTVDQHCSFMVSRVIAQQLCGAPM